MRGLLVLAVVAVGLVFAVYNRFAGLLLYMWFAIFRPQEWSWGAVSSYRLSFIIGAVFVLSCLVTGVWPYLRHPIAGAMVTFMALCLVSQAGAVNPAEGWIGLDLLGRMIVTSLLAITLITTRRRFLLALAVVAGSMAFHGSKLGVGYVIRGGARFNAGLGGLFSDNNDFALAVARIISPLVAFAQNTRVTALKLGVAAAAPLCVLAVVASFSRGGFLAIASSGLAFILLQRQRAAALVASVVVVMVLLILVPIPAEYYDRLQLINPDVIEEVEEGSALGRLHFWTVARQMADDRWFGVGLRGYPSAYDSYDTTAGGYGHARAVHSSHFQVLGELGYPGALVWIALHALALLTLWRVRRRGMDPARPADQARFLFTCANGLFASQVAFLVGGAFVTQALNDLNWITFALVVALDRLSQAPDMDRDITLPAPPASIPSSQV